MSEAYDKGRDFERAVAAIIRRKVDPTAKRDSKSGALDHRKSDIFTELPISIECKHHEKIDVRKFFRQAKAAAHQNEMPAAVFPIDNEITALVPFEALVNLFVEIRDLTAEVAMLREPEEEVIVMHHIKNPSKKTQDALQAVGQAVAKRVQSGSKTCKNGHIVTSNGRCMWKGCPYSTTFNAKKAAKGKKK